ncbi:DUF1003 domain-containing protein [Fluviicola chungangensis]|uniref:DUF1003 domain-containing protein n=1 Tax=Fluviicola chungangensis TaxID=2597671 RepID=A0A556N2Y2_9FLAO|nr:DUF1003 domain-containing protein [Fluviicola chungangensis]TSJ46388.1 DUF1003 domain-containing protein [Fluviicola chungangensis]
MGTFRSDLSNTEFPLSERISARTIRGSILELIQKENPDFNETCHLSISELNNYREKYLSDMMQDQLGELSDLDKTVLASLNEKKLLSDQLEDQADPDTLGQRVADKVATFGGSWTFIISFMAFLLLWIAFNAFFLLNKGFDPYPFILLNLILSCLAALQAPVIMMSQNRQEEKDRERAKKDYMINLKSEVEIRLLHDKIDHLIIHQQQELLEMQKMQLDTMKDLLSKHKEKDE